MRVFTESYLNNKKKFDKRAEMWGEPVETVDWNGGFAPIDKTATTNLQITEKNIQDRFNLEEVNSEEIY